jgi:ketosteroid isomerase-like protein
MGENMKIQNVFIFLVIILAFACSKNENSLEKVKDEIWQTVLSHNKSWAELEDLNEQGKYIHENIIFVKPGDKNPIEGKKAYLEDYQKWMDAAEVHFFKELNPRIKIYCKRTSAVVYYDIDMAFTYEGKEETFKGREMMFLVKENDKWLLVSDKFSAYPGTEEEE